MGRIGDNQALGQAILAGLQGSPEWIRDYLGSSDPGRRMVAEEALAAYLVNRLKAVDQASYHDGYVGELL